MQKIIVNILVVLVLVGIIGCKGERRTDVKREALKEVSKSSVQKDSTQQKTYRPQVGVPDPNWKPDPKIEITRDFMGKKISFSINPNLVGGEVVKYVWKEKVPNKSFERYNSIDQLSKTVLLYSKFPKEVEDVFYFSTQPVKLEFMDSTNQTIKTIDIWENRPYKKIGNTKITYYDFDSEGQQILPYKKQKTKLIPTEYSLFTSVISEGKHVIVNYELRSLIDYKIIGVKHTLRIYDLEGNLKYDLKDLPSVDGAVVSNDGKYMMYIFGGIGLATANNPFGTIERKGWALMRLQDKKDVYKEYTDNGILAFGRLWKDTESDLIFLAYSTPNIDDLYDYDIYFNFNNNRLYRKQWTQKEWGKFESDYYRMGIKNMEYYLEKYSIKYISIDELFN